jgi:hypothetical protein
MAKRAAFEHAGISRRNRSVADRLTAKRSGRLRWFALTLPALALALMAVPAASAGVRHDTAGSAGATYYAIGKPVCKQAKPGHATCFAMRRVEVKRGTPGARPFKLAGGASQNAARTGPDATIGPAGGLTPSDLATAYDFSSTATGTGQTVAIVDAYNDPDINADLQTFDTEYGLATCNETDGCLRVVSQTGTATLPSDDTTGWSVEESLDVETVHSVCQHCKIILLEANSSSNSNLATAVDEAATLDATEISNSYGSPETTSEEAAYNHPGIVITASAGDDGYYDFDELGADGDVNKPNAPAAFNTVVAVGGTSLYLGQTATRQSETVWNDNGTKDYWEENFGEALGAGGGGCSTLITAKAWQSNVSDWADTACGTHRLVADISADADYLTGFDVYHSYNCGSSCSPLGWETIGGTSLASPIIAAMYALAGGSHGVEYPALTLYGHLGSTSLYDVTSGGNGYCGGEGAAACGDPNTLGAGILDCDYPASGATPSVGDLACDAAPGYDGPTGVGTPNGLGAFAKTGPTATIAGPKSVASGTTNTWTATTTDPFPKGKVTKYSWNWGDGTAATVTTTGSATHDYATGGTDTVTLTVTDNYGQTGTATYAVTVT